MTYFDILRPPSLVDASAPAYKDWLHLNILDHSTGAIGLVNASLHGAPYDDRCCAVGAALAHLPGVGWVGGIEVERFRDAHVGLSSIGLKRVAVSLNPEHAQLLGSVRDPENRLEVRVRAKAAAAPVIVDQKLPFGSGWISWYAAPRLDLSGSWVVGDLEYDLAAASGYHDHNWGRWHWGDDVGWEWGCFLAPPPGPAFVLSRATDRSHKKCGNVTLCVRAGDQRRTFSGAATTLDYSGRLETSLRRLPGAMAALHQDRARPDLPERVHVQANDGFDSVELKFTARAAAQIITADPMKRGYGFIHEIPGEFVCSGKIGQTVLSAQGLGIFEYVD